jgi:DNA segregation ATPase FtsK/SpoIIIE, S-DNA-T family
MSEQKQKDDNKDLVSRLAIIVGVIGGFALRLVWKGMWQKEAWESKKLYYFCVYVIGLYALIYAPARNLGFYLDRLTWILPKNSGYWLETHFVLSTQLFVLTWGAALLWFATHGAVTMIRCHRFQKAIDSLGVKNSMGKFPEVTKVVTTSLGQRKVLVLTNGHDIESIRSKKGILESSLDLFVQDVRLTEGSRQILEILVSDRELPKVVLYDDAAMQLTDPFSFLVGEGIRGFIVSTLGKVNHMIVAGASGGGKSFFVKQFLIGILQTSKHVQLYLIDLKKGVEVKVFEKLSNVLIAKDMLTAIQTLQAVAQEMDRRFEYLEKNGFTEIDCERDKLDRIVVLVDEASELFTLVKSSKSIKASAETARDLADRIAKLGRVAGIHLILATQKVVKDTIDTRIQTNINARMIFRVNTPASSQTVLGNKLAFDLPEIAGRGIWSVGSKDLVVQTPKLDNEEVKKKVATLCEKFNGEQSPLKQKMLSLVKDAGSEPVVANGAADPGVNAQAKAF